MKKRIISLVLVVIMAFSLCVPAAAAYTENVEINYRAIKLVLNGEAIVPCDASGNTVEPFIMRSSGTTYLPLRAVAQALGLDVKWDGPSNTVTLTSGGEVKVGAGPAGTTTGKQKVDITYRDIKVFLNGEELNLVNVNGDKVEPFILKSNSSVYLPLRVIGEALGLEVGWDSKTSTVTLEGATDPGPAPAPAVTYTVMFVDYDGTVLKTETVEEGKAATAPADPTREGYNFIGWNKDFNSVSSNMVVTALYEEVKGTTYTVMFVDYDGTILKTETVEGGKAATAPAAPTRDGYKFTGWSKSFDNVNSNLVVTALYEVNKPDSALNAEQIYAKCAPAVFYIEIYNQSGQAVSSGSGVFISADGKALTNHHVVEDAYSAKIKTTDGKVYNVSGYYDAEEAIDMALIQIDGNNFPYLDIGNSNAISGGQNIFTIGSPLGLDNTISTGIISNPNRVVGGLGYIQITAPISHGSSGGALINDKGQLIGITSAGFEDGQNLNLCVPIHRYNELTGDALRAFPITPEYSGAYVSFDTSMDVTVGGMSTLRISADPGNYTDEVYVTFEVDDETIATGEWGDWDGWDIDLFVYGEYAGSTTITISLLTADGDVILASDTLYVTVSSPSYSGASLYFNSSVELNVGRTNTVSISADPGNYTGDVTIRYTIGNTSIVGATWGDWYGWDIDLYVTGKATGSTTITISLVASDSGMILATKTMYVTVSGASKREAAYNALRSWISSNANATLSGERVYKHVETSDGSTFTYVLAPEDNYIYVQCSYVNDGVLCIADFSLDPKYDTNLLGIDYYGRSNSSSTPTFRGYAKINNKQFSEDTYLSFYTYEGSYYYAEDCKEIAKLLMLLGLEYVDYLYLNYVPGTYSVTDLGFVSIYN